jgi:hypothetical protein
LSLGGDEEFAHLFITHSSGMVRGGDNIVVVSGNLEDIVLREIFVRVKTYNL